MLRAVLGNGDVIEERADFPLGSGQRPMSDDDWTAKLSYLLGPVLSADEIEKLARHVATLDEAEGVGRLIEATLPG